MWKYEQGMKNLRLQLQEKQQNHLCPIECKCFEFVGVKRRDDASGAEASKLGGRGEDCAFPKFVESKLHHLFFRDILAYLGAALAWFNVDRKSVFLNF